MTSVETPVVFDFDIVEHFPEEICRNVFSNLTRDELKSASLVSKDWYSLIGRSPECMKKLPLSLGNHDKTESNFWPNKEINERLTTSTRKYESIRLYLYEFRPITSEVRDILKIRGRKWKKVLLIFMDFETSSDLFGVLSYIEQTVEDLTLVTIGVTPTESKIERCALKFPKLKVLTLHVKHHGFFVDCAKPLEFLVDCATLKNFAVHSFEGDDAVNQRIHEMLKSYKGLEKLEISTSKEFYNVDVSEGLQFKLTTLKVSSYSLNADQKMNLRKFLRSQLTTLKILEVSGWMGLEAAKMIFHMPNLTRFKLDDFDCTEEDIISLKTTEFRSNATITDLHLAVAKVDMLRIFFPVIPNVKHLEVDKITEETLDLIAETYPNLESLTASSFNVTDVSDRDILKNLKKLDFTYDKVGFEEPSCHFARLVDDVTVKNCKEHLLFVASSPEERSQLSQSITQRINIMKKQPLTVPEMISIIRMMKALLCFEP